MAFKTARIWKRKSTGAYYITWVDYDSVQVKRSVGKDARIAALMQVKVNEMLFEGKDPLVLFDKTREAGQVTLGKFFPVFMERHGRFQSRGQQDKYHQRFAQLSKSKMVSIPMSSVTSRMVYDYMHKRLMNKVAESTVNMELTILKTMYSKALKWEIIDTNPIASVEKYREKPKRDVFLTMEQAAALIKELPRTVGLIVRFAIYTGLRKENILSMTIDQIDFRDSQVRLTVKGGKPVTHPLSENALETARQSIGDRADGLVFPNPYGEKYHKNLVSFYRAVKRLDYRVGDDRLHFHDLRHVYGTWLAEAGVSLDAIRWLMHHEKRSTTDRYVSVKNSALAGLSDLIPKIPEE